MAANQVFRNVIRDISAKCLARQGTNLNPALVALMVKATILDPNNKFNVDEALSASDLEMLVDICVERLLDDTRVSLSTLKLQTYFKLNFKDYIEFVEESSRHIEERMQDVDQEIVDNRARTKEELEGLYRKIVSSVLLRSGLGDPTDMIVVRETTAALESVLPPIELGSFLSLSKLDKFQHLKELSQVVSGIRLFNKHIGKGGKEIENLVETVPSRVKKLSEDVLQQISSSLKTATALCSASLLEDQSLEDRQVLSAEINQWQYSLYLSIIQDELLECSVRINRCVEEVAIKMAAIKQAIESKSAVATDVVFPKFIGIANAWGSLRLERDLGVHLGRLLSDMIPLAENIASFPLVAQYTSSQNSHGTVEELAERFLRLYRLKTSRTNASLEKAHSLPDIDLPVVPAASMISNLGGNLEVLLPGVTHNFENIPLQYGGFCVVNLVLKHSLVPVDKSIGLIRDRESYYGFLTVQDAQLFAQDPNKFYAGVLDAATRSVELIDVLQLFTHFAPLAAFDSSLKQGAHGRFVVTKRDGGTQTEANPMGENIVSDYEWNEWELRRKALKLANLRTKKTHSTQTYSSNYRRENATQVFLPKENGSQTKKDASTSVPRPVTYIQGLRGGDAEHVGVVDLTRSIGPPHAPKQGKQDAAT